MIHHKPLQQGIFLLENVFTPSECQDIIDASEQSGFEVAPITTLNGPVLNTMIRNNSRHLFFDEAKATVIWAKISSFFPAIKNSIPYGLNDMFRVYRYHEGERFMKHRDGSYSKSETEFSFYTFIVYLNDNFEGGTTTFDRFEITPKTGSALCFPHPVKHSGSKVVKGVKYALRTDVMYRISN